MTDDAQRVGGRGKLFVALIVLAVVAAIVVWVLGRDDMRSTPLEDAAAGRDLSGAVGDPTDDDPGTASPETARPQGRAAPDSNEGQTGAGAPALTGEAPPTSDPGRNAPAGDNRPARSSPNGGQTSR